MVDHGQKSKRNAEETQIVRNKKLAENQRSGNDKMMEENARVFARMEGKKAAGLMAVGVSESMKQKQVILINLKPTGKEIFSNLKVESPASKTLHFALPNCCLATLFDNPFILI